MFQLNRTILITYTGFTKLEEEREEISKYFQKAISQHPAVKNEKLLSLLELDLYDSHTGKRYLNGTTIFS